MTEWVTHCAPLAVLAADYQLRSEWRDVTAEHGSAADQIRKYLLWVRYTYLTPHASTVITSLLFDRPIINPSVLATVIDELPSSNCFCCYYFSCLCFRSTEGAVSHLERCQFGRGRDSSRIWARIHYLEKAYQIVFIQREETSCCGKLFMCCLVYKSQCGVLFTKYLNFSLLSVFLPKRQLTWMHQGGMCLRKEGSWFQKNWSWSNRYI